MLNTIHGKIKTTLDTLTGTGTGKPLSVVYQDPLDENENYSGFPCAIIAMSSFDNNYLTSAENLFGCTFKIYVIQETKQAGMAKAHRILRSTVDSILDKFGDDWNQGVFTGGGRIWWRMDLGNSFYDSDENVLYYELNLTTNFVYNIT